MEHMTQNQAGKSRPSQKQIEEQNRLRWRQELDRLSEEGRRCATKDLPLPWKFTVELLGLIKACHWSSSEHVVGLKTKGLETIYKSNYLGKGSGESSTCHNLARTR